MTLAAEASPAEALNRRIEPDIPRRRYVPGKAGPATFRTCCEPCSCWLPSSARSRRSSRGWHAVSAVREVIEILLVPAPQPRVGRAAGDLRLGAGQAQEVRLVVRGHHPRAGDGGVGDSAGRRCRHPVEESATLATSVVLFVVLLLARRSSSRSYRAATCSSLWPR